MGKKRAVAATTSTPVFPFPAAAGETEPPHHFSDYGFDPQLLRFSQLPDAKRHQQQQPPPQLEHARFKLQKPISKKHQHAQHNGKQRRRGWWSSAASAALLFFKRPSSKSSPAARAAGTAASSSCGAAAAFAPRPLYFADDGGDDDSTGCTCWSPAVRSGHLAAAELGISSVRVPYVSLRDVNLRGGAGGTGGAAPAMPIYLVT
ncbi:hypothetical protein CFC21_002368 [Triticum aestivum]|uniref:Uncharacterized protein n=2 Tax=Triticum TaxID=4564 RepID=A0A3B5Y0K7_WHEAT|nr:uncharacterized protein LOC119276507 [Triticum dicoccoides]XP_044414570.1 uncharacterized protein LOC123138703 [Triticum aestivum]XP_048553703.1 uncharacterized protein LOC125534548 [Triticum urartu]KAF6984338.1 hypothetical protein CFC21_002364 [Triticum aestivum]KAF6984342.1 hypothetical protein CFC21_002368 [Triticum aestivum]